MTKRMIDADVLKAWIGVHEQDDEGETGQYVVDSFDLINKIDELSTPIPVAQEDDGVNKSDYDMDGNKNFMG